MAAQAQTVTLVSNLGQSDATPDRFIGTTWSAAQKFTTGDNEDGYTLSSVAVDVTHIIGTAVVWQADIYSDSSGNPGTRVHRLTAPAVNTGQKTWMAPANATLAANTSYFVLFQSNHDTYNLETTDSTSEDAGGANGWSIADKGRHNLGSGWTDAANVLKIRIRGEAVTPSTTASIAYSGSFTETAANKGFVTGSVTATLTGDTFTSDVVSGNHVSVANVPPNLNARFNRISDTVVTLTLSHIALDHANDVSNITITFADDAFVNETASTVAGSSKNDIAIDFDDTPIINISNNTFSESRANDGSVTGGSIHTLSGETFTSDVVSGNHVSASNVPDGLTAVFSRQSGTVVTMTLTGNATNHARARVTIIITFADAAFTGGDASSVSLSQSGWVSLTLRDPAIITYAGSFTEAAANDGSVTGSVTATLSGDGFVNRALSAHDVTASNVPDGLTAVFTRQSGTVVTMTLTGNATAHADANDVSNLTITFANAAFENSDASSVTGSSNSDLAIDFDNPSSIAYTGSFTEAAANDGSVTGTVTATLSGDTFASDVVSANHVTASSVPTGLTASFNRTSDTEVTLTFSGSANNHANANDVSNLTITFADAAFTGGDASNVTGATKSDLAIDFDDNVFITYAGGFTETAENRGHVTGSVTATLTGDTFTSDVVSGNHVSISNVPPNLTATLTRTSNTVVTLTLSNAALDHINDVSNIKITFADDAFVNETASTVAGSSKNDIAIDFDDTPNVYIRSGNNFSETAANDGSLTGILSFILSGDTFATNVVSGNHVSISNVPDGLTAVFTRTSDTLVTLTFSGIATNHAFADGVWLTVTFADDAFDNNTATEVANSSSLRVRLSFSDPLLITYAGSFTETATNDGSVTGSVTATLSGDTFANDVVSATPPHVTVTNVPDGLTAVPTRTSNTVVTLTLTGNATTHADANDVSNLTISFADDAFVNQTASTVANSSKSDIEVDFKDASSITYSGSFTEVAANDGSVTGTVTATLTGDTFAPGTGEGGTTAVGVTPNRVPPGMTAVLTRTSDTVVTLTLTGNANNHADTNDVSDLTISFANAAFANEAASNVADSSKNDIEVDFRDASSITYSGSFTEVAANDGSVTGTVTATISGDTYAAASSGDTAAGVNASNVPTGLTAVLKRTSATVVTLTLTGSATAHTNADDVSNLTITFTDAAFENEAASLVGNTSKNDIDIDFRDTSRITYAGSFTEDAANDGSVSGTVPR